MITNGEAVELFGEMFSRATKFVAARIENPRDQAFFLEESEFFTSLAEAEFNFDYISDQVQESKTLIKDETFSKSLFSSEKQYRILAIETALDVVESINTRFITGGGGERFYYGK